MNSRRLIQFIPMEINSLDVGPDGYHGPNIFSKSDSFNKFTTSGSYIPVTFTTDRITIPNKNFVQASFAEGNGFRAVVYENTIPRPGTLGQSFVDIVDINGVTYREASLLSLASQLPQVQYLEDGYGKNFLALCVSNLTALNTVKLLSGQYFDATDPTAEGVTVVISDPNEVHNDYLWDMDKILYPAHTTGPNGQQPDGTAIDGYQEALVVYKREIDSKTIIATLDSHGNKHRKKILEIQPTECVSVNYLTNDVGAQRIFLLYRDKSTSSLDGYAFDPDLTEVISQVSLDFSAFIKTCTLRNLTITTEPSDGSGQLRIFAEYQNAGSANQEDKVFIRSFNCDWNLANVTNVGTIWNTGLASKAFTYNSNALVLTTHETGLQSTYFLQAFRFFTHPVTAAKIFYGIGDGLRKSGLSNVVQTGNDFTVVATRICRFLSDATSEKQVASITFNMNPDALQSVQLGPTLIVGGGVITGYDRLSQELGYHLYPENITLSANIVQDGNGFLEDGYRSFQAVYSWTDRNGDVYKSSPSEAIGRTYNLGASNQSETIAVPSLSQTDFDNKAAGINIEIYRTVAGGSTYYLVNKTLNANTTSTWTVAAIAGNQTDENISNNEILYTTGGVLVNIAPPASNILAVSKNRVFLVPMDDPETVWFSKEKVEGIGVEFAEELQIRISKGGNNTGLATMDDKILIFKEREIYFIAGDGPNDLGQGGFSPIRPVSSDVGCVDSSSIINFGQGILFKSHKGIYMIDRSSNTPVYIGAPVEKWNQWRVLSADLLDEANQVRFLLEGGQGVLVYDYFHQQWGHFTNHSGRDATVHQGKYHWLLSSDAKVRKESDTFLDVNFKISTKIRTPWQHLRGLQGYQRVKRASIIGKYRSPHDMVVNVYTDYDDVNIRQTATFTSSESWANNDALEYELHIRPQKCEAIMFEIYDSSQTGTCESYQLNTLALDIGVKKGINKKSFNKRK